MGLERGNGGLSYYHKRRVGRSVRSEYVGSGVLAEFAAKTMTTSERSIP